VQVDNQLQAREPKGKIDLWHCDIAVVADPTKHLFRIISEEGTETLLAATTDKYRSEWVAVISENCTLAPRKQVKSARNVDM
jgi:phosphoribosyl-ATP pyrophosphohydrolase